MSTKSFREAVKIRMGLYDERELLLWQTELASEQSGDNRNFRIDIRNSNSTVLKKVCTEE